MYNKFKYSWYIKRNSEVEQQKTIVYINDSDSNFNDVIVNFNTIILTSRIF